MDEGYFIQKYLNNWEVVPYLVDEWRYTYNGGKPIYFGMFVEDACDVFGFERGKIATFLYEWSYEKKQIIRDEFKVLIKGFDVINTRGGWFYVSTDNSEHKLMRGEDVSDKIILRHPDCKYNKTELAVLLNDWTITRKEEETLKVIGE